MKKVATILLVLFSLLREQALAVVEDSVSTRIDLNSVNGLVLEDGVTARIGFENGKRLLYIETVAAPRRGPAAYLTTATVVPGKQYTYFLTGYRRASCRVLLYVISPKGNVLWPGADIEQGISRSVFTVPEDVSEVTLGLSFLYPEEIGGVFVEGLDLVEGSTDSLATGMPNNLELLMVPGKTWVIWIYIFSMLILGLILYFTNRSRPLQDIFIKKQK